MVEGEEGMESKNVQAPISEQKIFKIMLWIVFPVCGVFLLKNVIGGNLTGIITVGITAVVFSAALIIMRVLKVSAEYQQLAAAIGLTLVEFVISLNSGSYYSDDFPLLLAIIAMTALYFKPKYTAIQLAVCDVLLILLYMIHPEKAESLSQYIMCVAIFNLAAFLIFLTIKRGRSYIAISENRACEAEKLLNSLTKLGNEVQENFENSTNRIEALRTTRKRLDDNTAELKQGSEEIMEGARDVANTCDDVKTKVSATGEQVATLTEGVHNVEDALAANQQNIEEMSQQIESVQSATRQVNQVFHLLGEQMQRIFDVTKQLDSIASSTNMLSLNASIEATRAGQNGAGFAVVASKVRDLAVDSTACSSQVAGVVEEMQSQIQETTRQLAENDAIIETSLTALNELQDGFRKLTKQFGSLYQSIENQNNNVSEVDAIFEQLRSKIDEVCRFTENNKNSVEAITDAILVYKEGVEQMVDDSMRVHTLSSDMLKLSGVEEA